uniref:Putative LOC100897181 [Metaseiulus occidentalis] n=1 Tax=Lepeophtheirus salmonis TaxID=72036 RepID=A0A0K2TNT7_LEPSM
MILHVTCLAHGLNRIVTLCPDYFENTNTLISEVKKVFFNSGDRKREFTALCQAPLPPAPILMR